MKHRFSQWFGLFTAAFSLIAAVLLIHHFMQQQANRPPQAQTRQIQSPEVAVVAVKGAEYTARIRGYGEAKAHYSLSLKAQTSGRVIQQAKSLEPGCRVTKGTLLVQLDDSGYRSAVAEAESELANARLDLLEEQRAALQAKVEWQASGLSGKPDSSLVLHEPQLTAAKAAVIKAETALESAEDDLRQTQISSPFDAIVIERQTSPGSYIQAGSEVATLYSTDLVEIAIPLSTSDWSNLPDDKTLTTTSWPVQVTGLEDTLNWSGRVLRAQQHLDTASRQRTLLIAVDAPFDQSPPLLPGTFVEAEITGRTLSHVWQLPGSALSQRGELWYVTDDDTLARFSTQPVFSSGDYIYVEVPEEFAANPMRVVVHPLNSYLPGMLVHPVLENGNA